jgi:hypothetical protein
MSMKPLMIHSPSFVATAFANKAACACRRFRKDAAVTSWSLTQRQQDVDLM